MIEEIVTSKTRAKLLQLFLTHMDDKYYLRELERMLDESLSHLRRQLIKLERMGILIAEEEANLKYYRLNKNFNGIDELRMLVLGKDAAPIPAIAEKKEQPAGSLSARRIKYDIFILIVSLFILGASSFIIYTSTKNIMQAANLISQKNADSTILVSAPKAPGEMASRRWKVIMGSGPVFSSEARVGERDGKEL